MKLTELLAELIKLSHDLPINHGLDPNDVEVKIWVGDDLVPVTHIDYDCYADDEPWVVEICKAGDP